MKNPLRRRRAPQPDQPLIARLEWELLGIDPGLEAASSLGLNIHRHGCCGRPVQGDEEWCPACTCFADPCPNRRLPDDAPHPRWRDCPA